MAPRPAPPPLGVASSAPTLARALVISLALVLLGCGRARAPGTADLPAGAGRGARLDVTHVVDGDTVELRLPDGTTERARLLGIDTPETVKPNAPVDCFGPEASARTKALLPEGTAVLVQRDAEARDRYGRVLVYLWRAADGLFVNRTLVAEGLARTLSMAPNTAHRADLAATQATARAAGTGLWGACGADGDDPP